MRIYSSNAERQAAYRRRRRKELDTLRVSVTLQLPSQGGDTVSFSVNDYEQRFLAFLRDYESNGLYKDDYHLAIAAWIGNKKSPVAYRIERDKVMATVYILRRAGLLILTDEYVELNEIEFDVPYSTETTYHVK